ncbi:MAG: PP2C family serine/threonine-protein phosphatase [Pseudomonadota bacterium]
MTSRKKISLLVAQLNAIGSRPSNEDSLAVGDQDDLACFVISDGTGGHAAGEVASRLVAQEVIDRFMLEASFGTRALRSYIDSASAKVALNKRLHREQQDMSATVAALLIDQKNSRCVWGHMGDTRLYLFRNHKISAMTKDHSLAQRFIEAGFGTQVELRMHPQRSMLFAAIGADGGIQPDITVSPVELHPGDAFLICSDGFWEWVREPEMELCLADAGSVQDWLDAMNSLAELHVQAANKLRDNFSAIALWVGEPVKSDNE